MIAAAARHRPANATLQRYRNYLFADLPVSSGALYARAGLAYWKLIKIGNHIATYRWLAASAHTVGAYVVGAHTVGTYVVSARTLSARTVSARTVSAHIVIGTYSI